MRSAFQRIVACVFVLCLLPCLPSAAGATAPVSALGETTQLQPPHHIDHPTTRAIFPWTVVDSKNVTHVIYAGNDHSLWYTNDASGAFAVPQIVDSQLGANREPFAALALGPDDSLHMVYTLLDGDKQVYYRHATMAGAVAQWSDRQEISSGFKSFAAHLTVDGNNNAHIVWIDNRCGVHNVFYRVRYADGSLSGISAPNPDCVFQNRPQVTIASDGTVHIAYQHDHEVMHARLTDKGWANTVMSASPKLASLNPSITTNGQKVYVSWDEGVNQHDVLFRWSNDNGQTWSDILPISNTKQFASFPNILYNRVSQRVYIVWSDSTDGTAYRAEVWYREFDPATNTLTGSRRLTWTPGASTIPIISIGSGRISIVWQDKQKGEWQLYHIDGRLAV